MAKPVITMQDLYTNPQMQGAISSAIVPPGSSHVYVDQNPVVTANSSIQPFPDKPVPVPEGLFCNDAALVGSNNPTSGGGTIIGPAGKRSVFF